MTATRREVIFAGVGLGVALATSPCLARWAAPSPLDSFGVVPAGGARDQTAMLQEAADAAASSGASLFLPPGIYSTRLLELKSGTHLVGVPGKSILRSRDGGGLVSMAQAADIRLEGLVLDGGARNMGVDGALLAARMVQQLQLSNCCFRRSGSAGIYIARCDDVVIADNIVHKAATGIAVTDASPSGSSVVVRGNIVRDVFFRKYPCSRGNGILIEAPAEVSGNVVENAPGFGILVGYAPRDVSITGNRVRKTYIGIGVPAGIAATAQLGGNTIADVQNGAIRAMSGLTPIGPDLSMIVS